MHAGRIAQVGAPGEIYSQPTNRFVADFIGLMNFIPGRILARSGDQATVEFLAGHRINVVDRSALTRDCVVAVRPEDIALSASGTMRCRVEVRNYSGHLIDYKVSADGVVLRVQTAKTESYQEGDQLAFAIKRALLLPAGPA
jgi:ABC-type Fe3+/spermidine/putrescine transport system ATPase subunit